MDKLESARKIVEDITHCAEFMMHDCEDCFAKDEIIGCKYNFVNKRIIEKAKQYIAEHEKEDKPEHKPCERCSVCIELMNEIVKIASDTVYLCSNLTMFEHISGKIHDCCGYDILHKNFPDNF